MPAPTLTDECDQRTPVDDRAQGISARMDDQDTTCHVENQEIQTSETGDDEPTRNEAVHDLEPVVEVTSFLSCATMNVNSNGQPYSGDVTSHLTESSLMNQKSGLQRVKHINIGDLPLKPMGLSLSGSGMRLYVGLSSTDGEVPEVVKKSIESQKPQKNKKLKPTTRERKTDKKASTDYTADASTSTERMLTPEIPQRISTGLYDRYNKSMMDGNRDDPYYCLDDRQSPRRTLNQRPDESTTKNSRHKRTVSAQDNQRRRQCANESSRDTYMDNPYNHSRNNHSRLQHSRDTDRGMTTQELRSHTRHNHDGHGSRPKHCERDVSDERKYADRRHQDRGGKYDRKDDDYKGSRSYRQSDNLQCRDYHYKVSELIEDSTGQRRKRYQRVKDDHDEPMTHQRDEQVECVPRSDGRHQREFIASDERPSKRMKKQREQEDHSSLEGRHHRQNKRDEDERFVPDRRSKTTRENVHRRASPQDSDLEEGQSSSSGSDYDSSDEEVIFVKSDISSLEKNNSRSKYESESELVKVKKEPGTLDYSKASTSKATDPEGQSTSQGTLDAETLMEIVDSTQNLQRDMRMAYKEVRHLSRCFSEVVKERNNNSTDQPSESTNETPERFTFKDNVCRIM